MLAGRIAPLGRQSTAVMLVFSCSATTSDRREEETQTRRQALGFSNGSQFEQSRPLKSSKIRLSEPALPSPSTAKCTRFALDPFQSDYPFLREFTTSPASATVSGTDN